MRSIPKLLILTICLGVAAAGTAQPPKDREGGPGKKGPKGGAGTPFSVDDFVARMMAFDKNMDGKLTRDEVTDKRLLRLFDQADTNKDGVVTREELTALATKMAAEEAAGGGGFGPPSGGGPGGFGPPGGGPGGFGGPGKGKGKGGPPQPGQIMPPMLQEALQLTAAQKKQINDLQKEVDAKLDTILTDTQKKRFKEMRERGPGKFGPPGGPGGGPGGPGGPGGGPPGGFGFPGDGERPPRPLGEKSPANRKP
jgi:hypothetical protein